LAPGSHDNRHAHIGQICMHHRPTNSQPLAPAGQAERHWTAAIM
jgi:hypothetical protein